MGLDTLSQNVLLTIRCPTCHQRHFDAYLTGASFAVVQCRCKTKFRTDAHETFVITNAASVSRTFDGRSFDAFGLAIR